MYGPNSFYSLQCNAIEFSFFNISIWSYMVVVIFLSFVHNQDSMVSNYLNEKNWKNVKIAKLKKVCRDSIHIIIIIIIPKW